MDKENNNINEESPGRPPKETILFNKIEDYIKIPEAMPLPISTTLSPEEIKDIAAIFEI